MRYFYTVLLYMMVPVFVFRLMLKSRKNPAYRERWKERFGYFETAPLKNVIWIHAVSVGEARATQLLVKQLRSARPDCTIVVSTTTPTGAEHVHALYGDEVTHLYFPYDLQGAIQRWLKHINPCLLILMETEIWPNLISACKKRGIAVVLANARMSEKSAKGYARLGDFTAKVLSCINLIAAQSSADADRFIALGYPQSQIQITGSVKFDMRQPAIVQEQSEAIRRLLGAGRPIWIAASTREGEEEAVLAAHARVLEKLPLALLLLVPRHPERFDKVAQFCEQKGFAVVRRSSGRPCLDQHQIFVGDSMGELAIFYQTADIAFVGGSLVDTGGQNIMEPASVGLPVLFGPSMFNFAAISEMMLCAEAAVRVEDAQTLADQVVAWLSDASERARIGENGRRMVEENRGATDRLVSFILPLIKN